jgi:hypothetical protein
MKAKFIFLGVLILFSFVDAANIENPDKPLKGVWDFKPEKVWEIDKAGDEVFARPGDLEFADDGTVFLHDYKLNATYIFDNKGKFKKAFGHKGEGPGEVKQHRMSYFVNDKFIVVDSHRLHYFKKTGEYIKSVPNNYFQKPPHVFLNEDEFIYAPLTIASLPGNKGKIALYNLKSGKEKVLKEFSVFEGGIADVNGGRFAIVVEVLLKQLMPRVLQSFK